MFRFPPWLIKQHREINGFVLCHLWPCWDTFGATCWPTVPSACTPTSMCTHKPKISVSNTMVTCRWVMLSPPTPLWRWNKDWLRLFCLSLGKYLLLKFVWLLRRIQRSLMLNLLDVFKHSLKCFDDVLAGLKRVFQSASCVADFFLTERKPGFMLW